MTAPLDPKIPDILHFWFDKSPEEKGPGQARAIWFQKKPAFDQAIRDRFLATYEQAARGDLDHWQTSAQGCLALVLLLDQFPRNLFRDDPQAFATDGQARAIADRAIGQGLDQQLPPIQQWFLYLPFMHSEARADQARSVRLFADLRHHPDIASAYDYALKHQDVIERFGRFPHRNAVLQRESTPAEVAFLQQPGSSF